jgi:hypothetical protein
VNKSPEQTWKKTACGLSEAMRGEVFVAEHGVDALDVKQAPQWRR